MFYKKKFFCFFVNFNVSYLTPVINWLCGYNSVKLSTLWPKINVWELFLNCFIRIALKIVWKIILNINYLILFFNTLFF